jgi:hypothetical protein
MRTSPTVPAVPLLTVLFLALLPAVTHAQPAGMPEWLQKINPAKYILLAADIKPPFAWGTAPDILAEGQGIGVKDAQGHVTRQTVFFMHATQTVKLAQPYVNTAATKPPTTMRWTMEWTMTVGIYQNEEMAKAALRTYYLSDNGPFTAEDENCLNDPRLRGGRGAAGRNGSFVRYRNLLLKIDTRNNQEVKSDRPKMDIDLWNAADRAAEAYQYNLIPKLATMWLDKVVGPDRADLHVEPGKVLLRWWDPSPLVEREIAADKQYVAVQVDNKSAQTAAVGAKARLLLCKAGQAEFAPVCGPVAVPDIPPGSSRVVLFTWDLQGKQIENAWLRAEVEIPGVDDANVEDNHCDLKVSIYYAHNGTTPFRWVEDSYSFPNYDFTDREGEEMLEGILATVVGQVYTDPQAATVLTRLIFPQTFTRFINYLHSSMKEGAGGHCYGLAATAALYFLDSSLRPGGGRTCDLSRSTASANVNIYQRAQMVPLVQALLSGDSYFGRNWGPVQCLDTVRARLKTQRKPVILSIGGTETVQQPVIVNGVQQMQNVQQTWGHALLAYKLVEVPGRDSAVYVYDSNLAPKLQWPGHDPSTALGINGPAASWGMSSSMKPLYQGVDRLAAREITREVPVAEANALVATIKAKLAELMSWFEKANKIMTILRCPADALFTDPQGRRVGILNGRAVNEVPGAEIRSQGEVEIYVLPRNVQFTVQLTGTGSGVAGFDVIRYKPGALEVTVFSKLPVSSGIQMRGSVAGSGVLDRLTSSSGQSYAPTLVGTLQGDRVGWQGGNGAGTGPADHTPPVGSVEVVVCEEAPDGQPRNINTTFVAPKTLTALVRYTNLPPNTEVKWVWTQDGKPLADMTKIKSGTGWHRHTVTWPTAAPPGHYHLSVTVNGRSVAERDITVRGGGSTTTPHTDHLQTFSLPGPSASGLLARHYDRNNFAITLGVTWSRVGTILDTVGINAAPVGSFTVVLSGDGHVHLQIFDPGHTSSYRLANGWHVLPSTVPLRAGESGEVTLSRDAQKWLFRMSVGGRQQTITISLPIPASGNPIYVGDFPGDDNWPASFNPHRGMTGTVKLLSFTGKQD